MLRASPYSLLGGLPNDHWQQWGDLKSPANRGTQASPAISEGNIFFPWLPWYMYSSRRHHLPSLETLENNQHDGWNGRRGDWGRDASARPVRRQHPLG